MKRLALAALAWLLASGAQADSRVVETTEWVGPECTLKIERYRERDGRVPLRIRPGCPIGLRSTRAAVDAALKQAGAQAEVSLAFGRIARYPWLSRLLAREASAAPAWNPKTGRPHKGHSNPAVAQMLHAMPEFGALFGYRRVTAIAVEKVLVKRVKDLDLADGQPLPPTARLPWDAQLWVRIAPTVKVQ